MAQVHFLSPILSGGHGDSKTLTREFLFHSLIALCYSAMTEQAPSSFSPMARLAPIEGSEKGLNHHAVRHLFEKKTSQLCLTSYGPPAPAMGLRRRARSATKSKQLTKLQGGLG